MTSQHNTSQRPNRLIGEKSPYLLQHATNPVDWYPWGEEAFEKARKEEKPIFLSIGYSTCYWCHVMEREVFEDPEIAELMNATVVSIKVDREERPDIDKIYMSALQAMSGSGGWPMSMFLTPDLKPFFAATYIPPVERHGRAGFPQILKRIGEVWQTDRKQIVESSDRIHSYLKEISEREIGGSAPDVNALHSGVEYFIRTYDEHHGGFGGAPKFPRPSVFNFLLRYHARTKSARALDMTLATLRHMAVGGMYDHLGGGFHRYSTDGQWHVPHFEKMLYYQAQLVMSYLEAFQITRDPWFGDVARDILSYVQRDLTQTDGGFFSAEDAESRISHESGARKAEGAFYVWTKDELDAILSAEESQAWCSMFGVEPTGNVEEDPHGVFTGKNVFHLIGSRSRTAAMMGVTDADVDALLGASRTKLFEARSRRPRPHLDDKILTSWNGLMISAFSKAHQVLGNKQYLASASRAARFILTHLCDQTTGELYHRYRDGDARIEAHLDDYAFLVQGLLDLYETELKVTWLHEAARLTEIQQKLFYDAEQGGFFDTSGRDRSLLLRTKEWYDGAEPSGNSIAVLNLLRLSQLRNDESLWSRAVESLSSFGDRLHSSAHATPHFLVALDFSLSKPIQVVLAGASDHPHTRTLLRAVHSRFLPNRVILHADGGQGQEFLAASNPFLRSLGMVEGKPTAYICENYTCNLPTTDPDKVLELLSH